MTRTTITIDEDLLADVKAEASRSGRTFSELVADALRERLARRQPINRPQRARLPVDTTVSGGLRPGVDLDNNAALRDVLDDDEGYWR
jgi:hypothetical protein